jgi:hypothetical protein
VKTTMKALGSNNKPNKREKWLLAPSKDLRRLVGKLKAVTGIKNRTFLIERGLVYLARTRGCLGKSDATLAEKHGEAAK